MPRLEAALQPREAPASKTSQPSPPLASRPGDASPCTSRTQDVPITVSPSPGLEAASLETIDEPARFDFTTTAHDPTSLGLDAAMGCLDVFSWIATASPSTGITPNDTPVSLEQSTAGLSDGPAATQAMVQPSRQIVPATLPIEEAGQAHLSSSITSAAIPAGQGSKGLEQGHGQGQHHHHHHHHHGSLVPELSWPAAINPFLFVRNTPVVQDGEIWTMPADSPSQTARPLALSENSLSSPSVRESENNGEAAAAAAASDDDNDEGGPRCACQAALSNLLLLRHVGRHQNADQQASSPLELCLRLQRLLHQTRDAQKSCSACQDDELAKTVLVMVARDVAGLYRAIVNDFAAASRHGRAAQNQRRGTNSRASSGMGGVAAVGAADHHLMQQPLPLPLPATSPLSDATQLRMGSKTIDGSVKFGFLRRLVGLKLRQASALLGELDGSMASTALGPLLRGICKHIDVTLGMLLVAEA